MVTGKGTGDLGGGMVSGIKTGLGSGLALHCGGRNFIGPAGGSGRGNLFASSAYGRIWIFFRLHRHFSKCSCMEERGEGSYYFSALYWLFFGKSGSEGEIWKFYCSFWSIYVWCICEERK